MDFVDPALHYVPRPGWRARIDARVDRVPPRVRRAALLVGVLLAHVALFERLRHQSWRPSPAPTPEAPLAVVWLSAPTPAAPPSPRKRAPRRELPIVARNAPRPATHSAPPDPPRLTPTPRANRPRLFGVDGQLLLPDAVHDDLAAVGDPRSRLDFKVPGLIEARTQAPRPAALSYEPTRFDEVWIDEKDLLSEALEKAVEKTTLTVRIPLPRAPGSKVVCKVSLLAAAGGCGIKNESDGYFVRLDDPGTLDAKEAAQCGVWWDAMATASTEAAWHAARRNFEANCRKPLAASASGSR